MAREVTINSKMIATGAVLLVTFFSGYGLGRQGFVAEVQRTDGRASLVLNQQQGRPENVDFSLFWDAWKVVDEHYVAEPDNQKRLYGAIAGMVAGLDDPFSMFMEPQDTSRFNEDISGNFEGIGAELVMKEGLITVVAPLDNSPALRAGLLPEDRIMKINGEDAPALLDEAVEKIRGKKGTTVVLTVLRNGQPQEISIERDTVEIKSVTYTLKDGVSIIKLNQFNANSVAQLDESLARAKQESAKAIVLDMRNNPGGLLDKAIEVASRFQRDGVVLVERDKNKSETELTTVSTSQYTDLPLVVLVNKGSASASEIVAGALQDHGRAKIVGETTFGKGSVQSIQSLKDKSSVRITIAEWLTPKRREINKQGIKPDEEVSRTTEDVQAGRDPQLDRALELLK